MVGRSRFRGAMVALATTSVALLGIAGPAAAASPSFPLERPIRATSVQPVVAAPIAVGPDHTCAVVRGGVECWGVNTQGQLGDGTRVGRAAPAPVLVAPGGAPLAGVAGIAAGSGFTCALLAAGGVVCWGAGGVGQLGNGRHAASAVPVPVSGVTTATSVSAGTSHACVALASGGVACWGRNRHGQLGDGTTRDRSTPVLVHRISNVQLVAAGGAHTCATYGPARQLKCWGLNSMGELGTGTFREWHHPVAVRNLSNVTALAAGDAHTCAAAAFNDFFGVYTLLFCWGSNTAGQADPSSRARRIPQAAPLLSVFDLRSLSAGGAHTCVVWGEGTACWGANRSGQVGDGSRSATAMSRGPQLGMVASIAAGGATSCAYDTNAAYDAVVWCWGENGAGQVGDGTRTDRSRPTIALRVTPEPALTRLAGATGLAAGSYQSCAIVAGGTVRCWGDNSVGELGDSTADARAVAVRVRRLSGAETIAAGMAHTCVIAATGDVLCWGYNFSGQIGDGTTNHRPTPVKVHDLGAVTSIAGGVEHTCAVLADSTVKCWGLNDDAQLGDGTIKERTTPVAVAGLTGVTQVAPGRTFTCALRGDGSVWCWGSNDNGQLGDGTFVHHRAPAQVTGVAGATAIAASSTGYACALLGDGRVTCWGLGAPGRPAPTGPFSPLPADPEAAPPPFTVDGVMGARQLGVGAAHACALLADATVTCWGANDIGQLGDGTLESREGPVPVAGLAGVATLAVGDTHACATLAGSGAVTCWGAGTLWQLGNGLVVDSAAPAAVLLGP